MSYYMPPPNNNLFMNYKSLLCAATLLAASGIAQAFPTYSISPKDGDTKTEAAELANFNLEFAWDFAGNYTLAVVDPKGAILLNEETGEDVKSENVFMSPMMDNVLVINFDSEAIAKGGNGLWTLTIPSGVFTVSTTAESNAPAVLDNEPNPVITAQYKLSMSNGGGSEDTPVVYPQIEFIGADPASGSKIAMLGGTDVTKVKLSTSDDAAVNYIGWYVYDVTNPDAPEYVAQGSENRVDLNRNGHAEDVWTDGLYITIGGEGHKLITGHTYSLDLTFAGIGYNVETNQYPSPIQVAESTECVASVLYEGLTEPEKYSAVTYVSVTPDPENYVIDSPELAVFDIQFSGMVKPDAFNYNAGPGMQLPAGEWEPYEGTEVDNGYAARWTFKFYDSLVESATGTISTYVTAKDQDGLYVKGNSDIDFGDYYYQMIWECNCGAPDLLSLYPTPFTDIESLSTITISNDKDGRTYVMALSYLSSGVEIRNLDGAVIRELGEPEFSDDKTTATWTFEPITENGRYVLMIPEHYFNLGEEFEGSVSNATSFVYFVDNGAASAGAEFDLAPVSIDPADGSNVESISNVVLTFADVTFYPMDGSAPMIQLYKLEGPNAILNQTLDVTELSQVESNDDWNPTVYTLKFQSVEEDGTYQVFIPQGVFCDETYDMEMGAAGHANGDIYITYVVGEGGGSDVPVVGEVVYDILPSVVTPENGSTVTELSDISIDFDDVVYTIWYEENGFEPNKASLYKLSDNQEELLDSKVVLDNMAHEGYNFMAPQYYIINFSPVTEDGQYKVVIPQATFGSTVFDETRNSGNASPEISLYYAIGQAVGVESIVDGAEVINVYDVNGVQVLKNANVEAAKELKSGLYIINGKKVMIRR